MDPEEALRQARQAAHTLMQSAPGSDPAAIANIADLLASAFTDLDEWLTKGGFLPAAWRAPIARVNDELVEPDRAETRLVDRFERALADDEELDRRFGTDAQARAERSRLARLLAREVICEIAEERALIERMLRSAVVQNFMDQAATRLAAEPPVAIRFAQPPPGFTKAGWDRLNEKRQGS
jgi:hypothetical protein